MRNGRTGIALGNLSSVFASTVFSVLFATDLILRTLYQSGKSPVLQVFADELGASALFLGIIISVSTFTGVILKPIIGWISDIRGRLIWLMVGISIFALVPFFYHFVETPIQLFWVRFIHGFATAIYGPITMAYVASINQSQAFSYFAWFGISRQVSLIAGPLLGAALVSVVSPKTVYIIIGLISFTAFIPTCFKRQSLINNAESDKLSMGKFFSGLSQVFSNQWIFLVALLEMQTKLAVYAMKAFLPILMLSNGASVFEAGLFLSFQEASNAFVRPFSSAVTNRLGFLHSIAFGLISLALGLIMISIFGLHWTIWIAAFLIGSGQAIFTPSAEGVTAKYASINNMGLTFGAVGSLRNMGKILGPIIAGLLATIFSVKAMFMIVAMLPVILAAILVYLPSHSVE